MTLLEKLVDDIPKQLFISVYRKNILTSPVEKKALHFKFIENDTSLSSVFAFEGQFLRIVVDETKKTVLQASVVEYTPLTQMHWVETDEMKHWSAKVDVYRHYKGGVYRVYSESEHTETGERFVNYTRIDCPKKQMWSRPSAMFHGYTEDGKKRFELIREGLVK